MPTSGVRSRNREVPIEVEELSVNTIRTLAMDAVQKAGSGHPGTPMALAPLTYVLWRRILRHSPRHPDWLDRDRFILSNGHASMLLYGVLHLTGYGVTLDGIRNFRRWGSGTPGHPERGETPGVETTTGPLGQGIMNSVGMAMAEAHLAATFNRPDHPIIDHRTYAICSDGDLMEGASHEAASLAGHLSLGKLVWVYDDNHITIEGDTALAYSDDVGVRFRGYGWHVVNLGEKANDLDALTEALEEARDETERPSLVIVRSHIAYGAPTKQDTAEAHGAPLGEDEVKAAKAVYGWPEDADFLVPDEVKHHMGQAVDRGNEWVSAWRGRLARYRAAHPELARSLTQALSLRLPDGWDEGIGGFTPSDGPLATRAASGKVLEALASRVPWLVGGSADLAGSNKTLVEGAGDFGPDRPEGKNLHWGVREHVMASASSGMALHGGVRPYAGSFLVFTDYARPGIRLASLMSLPVIYVMTHDSIGLGEDGPTHQPVEHLASLRAMPGLHVIRPADANETAVAWRMAMERTDGPTLMALTRQDLPVLDRDELGAAEGAQRGGYVIARERAPDGPDLILVATGSEVSVALQARRLLAGDVDARVVSLPCWEVFREQDRAYRDRVLPPHIRCRVSVEAASPFGWHEWVGDGGRIIGLDRFGASAPGEDLFRAFGFTAEHVAEVSRQLVFDLRGAHHGTI